MTQYMEILMAITATVMTVALIIAMAGLLVFYSGGLDESM